MVVVAYGKDIILAEQYEKTNDELFALFIRCNFPNQFEIAGKAQNDSDSIIVVMDNNPSQMSAKAVMEQFGITMQKILPWSPDLNHIENMYCEVRKRTNLAAKQCAA